MTLWKYAKDRSILILAWLLALLMSLFVIYLDLNIGRQYIRSPSLVYVFVLGVIILTLGIVYDYLRQRDWYKELHNAWDNTSDSDFTLCMQNPVTEEQKLMHELINRQYGSFMNELLVMRQQREQHVHFTNQWVHHMKTPVSVLHLLTQQPPTAMNIIETEDLLQNVNEEVERLARGLEMMLTTARLEKFELDLHVSRISIHHTIRQVINQNKKSLIRHQIFPKISGEDIQVESDEKWLQFIITQLVTNAIKYSKDKPGTKSLQFEIEQASYGILLHVKDEGIGIAEHDVARVFDPFFTGENGRKEGDATGMGLYLVKQVCARLGHTITVNSKIQEGTTFTIRFTSDSLQRGVYVAPK
ncbi:sensor histidine kinase [Paenibacillus sp. UMB4589-SE434]|uniref:sensor histidine kinase n=1 Tax=Paenibacillus sp. UMB4589-SE434 TaxID=3046314 RepID=UPI00254E10D5|nr:sensor histidine kinase [Paenibacillus sp. UMB4589-SE434]MDK8179289.1 sensor histidine kinase [Paenibacillus sp. UMB4589-SE434]